MHDGIDSDFFPEEQPLIGEIMVALCFGRVDPLIAFMTRGKPISPRAAFFIGSLIQDGIGEYRFEYTKQKRRGAPKTSDTRIRIWRAAIFVNWITTRENPPRTPPKREDAVRRVSARYHCDPKQVRKALGQLERWRAPPLPPRIAMRELGRMLTPMISESAPLLSRISEISKRYQ